MKRAWVWIGLAVGFAGVLGIILVRTRMRTAADALAGPTYPYSYSHSNDGRQAGASKGLADFATSEPEDMSPVPQSAENGRPRADIEWGSTNGPLRPLLSPPPSDPRRAQVAAHLSKLPTAAPGSRETAPASAPPDMRFQSYGVNPTLETSEEPVSTFSVDVDSAAYTVSRGYLERGVMPDPDSVRVEEFVNRYDYGYAEGPEVLQSNAETFASPNRQGYEVLRVGLKARSVLAKDRLPTHLVFVIDVSGSMDSHERLDLVKDALQMLVTQLKAGDRVSVVSYGTNAEVRLPPTAATQKHQILAAIAALRTEGSTNVQAGVLLGYEVARKALRPHELTRLVLCSDGVANNGVTSADEIFATVDREAGSGISLSTVGFGMGSYNDVLMEKLAKEGDGAYAYVDRREEAHRIFVQNLTGTLQTVAHDVKVQVEFDPEVVARYRLVGYENRALRTQDFANDRVDAGEVGAGLSVTALYEVKLKRRDRPLGSLRVRYKEPGSKTSRLSEQLLKPSREPDYARASGPTQLAFVAATFAEKLRGSYWARNLTYRQLSGLFERIPAPLRAKDDVQDLGRLIERAGTLDRRPDPFEHLTPVSAMDFDRLPALP